MRSAKAFLIIECLRIGGAFFGGGEADMPDGASGDGRISLLRSVGMRHAKAN